VHPLLLLLAGATVTFLATWYWRGHDARKATRAAELAAAAHAEADKLEWADVLSRLAELEASSGQFVDREALEKRFAGIEDKHKLTAAEVLNQHNTLHEYERARERLTGEFRSAIAQLQKDSRVMEPLPGQVADLKAKFEALSAQIGDIKTDMRANKLELKEDMKNNKVDILTAIRDLKINP